MQSFAQPALKSMLLIAFNGRNEFYVWTTAKGEKRIRAPRIYKGRLIWQSVELVEFSE